jgi:hypothetical protein
MKFSSVSYTHRSDREHDDNECIYRIKGFFFRYCLFSGPLSGEPDRVSQKIVLIKTVSITNSPLFCLSVIYIQKSLKRWKKDFFAVTEKISDLNSFYFHAKTILFWDYFFSIFWFVKRHSFKPRALHFQLNCECDVTWHNFHCSSNLCIFRG